MTIPPPDHITIPGFGISVRGYDRAQVDAYLGGVVEWLANAENRAVAAERVRESLASEVTDLRATITVLEQSAGLPAPQSMSAFSERMGQVLESALRAAQELRSEAEREAEERRESAASEAERILATARAEAERIVDGARRAEREIEESFEDLRAARADAIGSLLELQQRIAIIVGGPESSRDAEDAEDDDRADDDGADHDDTEGAGIAETAVLPVVEGTPKSETDAPPVSEDKPEDDDPLSTTGVLSTAAPTSAQPAVGRGADGNAREASRRKRSA